MHKNKETIYRCEHCNKAYFNSTSCKNHEKVCFRDEKNRTCLTCYYSAFLSGEGCLHDTEKRNEKISPTLFINCIAWESLEERINLGEVINA